MVTYQRSLSPFWELKRCSGEIHSTRPHSHAEWSLGLVTGGACAVNCRGTSVEVRAPALVWFSPETVHRCQPQDTIDWAFQMLYWEAPGAEGCWGARPLTGEACDRWLGFFEKLQTQPHTELPEFVAEGQARTPPVAVVPGVRPDRLYKRIHGLAPAQHRTVLRVRRAQQLLRDGAAPLDAALESGFYDQSQFTRLFRAFTGTTPGRYARSNLYKIDPKQSG